MLLLLLAVRFPSPSAANITAMNVMQLKHHLAMRGVNISTFLEKQELVKVGVRCTRFCAHTASRHPAESLDFMLRGHEGKR